MAGRCLAHHYCRLVVRSALSSRYYSKCRGTSKVKLQIHFNGMSVAWSLSAFAWRVVRSLVQQCGHGTPAGVEWEGFAAAKSMSQIQGQSPAGDSDTMFIVVTRAFFVEPAPGWGGMSVAISSAPSATLPSMILAGSSHRAPKQHNATLQNAHSCTNCICSAAQGHVAAFIVKTIFPSLLP
jgi:hypothetical protein|mmetsp:Transcript_60868/g.100706  ORF Transcript_60868/g.100706 Transcript_60868/m.100706 type:complete len:181 (-) Transcript_60868:1922-2464(-)